MLQANFDGDRDARSYAVQTIVEKRADTLSDGEFAWTWAHRAASERGAECQIEEHFMAATRNNTSSKGRATPIVVETPIERRLEVHTGYDLLRTTLVPIAAH